MDQTDICLGVLAKKECLISFSMLEHEHIIYEVSLGIRLPYSSALFLVHLRIYLVLYFYACFTSKSWTTLENCNICN